VRGSSELAIVLYGFLRRDATGEDKGTT